MKAIQQWFENHSISTHSIVGGILAAVGIYTTVPAVKTAVDAVVSPHPKIASLLAGIVAIALAYKGSHSTQGQAAQLIATAQSDPKQVQDAVALANAAAPLAAPVISVGASSAGNNPANASTKA